MDWDKLKIFHAAAEAGSFTHAGDALGMSQSAVSRQVSALEQEINVPLFHRHARGLLLTEQGEILFRAAHEILMKLEHVRAQLTDSREKPGGELRVTTTVALGTQWLTPRLGEFMDMYPDILLQLILTDDELDLSKRAADVAIRVRQPQQSDLIQRKLFTMRFHAYASPEYLKRFGHPASPDDLEKHRILAFGGPLPSFMQEINPLSSLEDEKGKTKPALISNNILALLRAAKRGLGIAVLPDYLVEENGGLVQVMGKDVAPDLEVYFVYPEELRSMARIQVFRDFLVAKAQRWAF